jgi:hypothetical protein
MVMHTAVRKWNLGDGKRPEGKNADREMKCIWRAADLWGTNNAIPTFDRNICNSNNTIKEYTVYKTRFYIYREPVSV